MAQVGRHYLKDGSEYTIQRGRAVGWSLMVLPKVEGGYEFAVCRPGEKVACAYFYTLSRATRFVCVEIEMSSAVNSLRFWGIT